MPKLNRIVKMRLVKKLILSMVILEVGIGELALNGMDCCIAQIHLDL